MTPINFARLLQVSTINYFLVALVLTIIIELFVAVLLGFRNKYQLLSIIFINCITNTIFNYLFWINNFLSFVHMNFVILLALEVVVVLVEWRLLVYTLGKTQKKLFLLSFVMNFCSFIAGLIIF